ncbi:viperin family antiviral radical SAM protein [Pseudomonas sp. NKUCC02_KPG]|uniref:viperin family antiviral radical SAM protein n=1 Tax=Pseudomonas sp. NKUCC02_KPG TaxID=2842124 RepID=UPI001C5B2C38|nr:viperin family antiviral radical SAM protein [Pseudomonas sp. NKUCC02_KPG]MBW3505720.1 viperin family antiviral radical SAM protein [Pseudomonas sp. NKUCC02_KPG]
MTHLQQGEGGVRPHVSELVINWHITEACNYKCRYCYAKWDGAGRELLHDSGRVRNLLDELQAFFHTENVSNPLRQHMSWSGIRLNLAGGEPLLYQDASLRVLDYARSRGMTASIITNGSRLTDDLIDRLAPLVSMLGLSLDSANSTKNTGIGRVDSRGSLLDVDSLPEMLVRAKSQNPALRLKVNTVVNALNHQEDMSPIIHALAPHRWKVLRMLQVVTHDLAVSSEDFLAFVARHDALREVMCVEDNGDMSESYIMIDPLGRFFQNTSGQQGYHYSRSIDAIGAERAFNEWRFSVGTYVSRYRSTMVAERP